MDNVLAGFLKQNEAFFAGIPPDYPLFWDFKNMEVFFNGNATLYSSPGDIVPLYRCPRVREGLLKIQYITGTTLLCNSPLS